MVTHRILGIRVLVLLMGIVLAALVGVSGSQAQASSHSNSVFVAHGGGNVGAPFGGEIGTIDLGTGVYTALTPSLGSVTSLAFDGTTLYAYETQSHSIVGIDPGTGAVVSSVSVGGGRLTDMAYDPTTGVFYAMGASYSRPLYTVDVTTGALGYIGNIGSSATGGGHRAIAFAPDGTLYVHATNSPGNFLIVDPSTAAVITTISGGIPGGALGLAVNPADGQLVGSECCGGGWGELGEKLFSVDPSTGTATLLFDFNDGRRMHDFAFGGTQTKADILSGSGVPGKGIENAPGLQKEFNPKSQAAANAGKK